MNLFYELNQQLMYKKQRFFIQKQSVVKQKQFRKVMKRERKNQKIKKKTMNSESSDGERDESFLKQFFNSTPISNPSNFSDNEQLRLQTSEWRCNCGKVYSHYSSLYLHLKRKHGGQVNILVKQSIGFEKPSWAKKKGRPKNVIIDKEWQKRLKEAIINVALSRENLAMILDYIKTKTVTFTITIPIQKHLSSLREQITDELALIGIWIAVHQMHLLISCHPETRFVWESSVQDVGQFIRLLILICQEEIILLTPTCYLLQVWQIIIDWLYTSGKIKEYALVSKQI